MERRVQGLLDDVFAGKSVSRQELQQLLKFDDLNMDYFLILYKKFLSGAQGGGMQIATTRESTGIYPTAIADQKMLKALPLVHYHQLSSNSSAAKAMLWVKKMQAGTGSSIVRKEYLKKLGSSRTHIGAKGTDLFAVDKQGDLISLVEVQIKQALADLKSSSIAAQCLHDIVSIETAQAIDEVWEKNGGACQKLVETNERLSRGDKSFQYHIPTIDEKGTISFRRKAPGGHALFGVEAILAAYRDQMRPDSKGLCLISSIGNGEDLSSAPDDKMVSWMIDHKIPIAMVTTTKTENDLKGGQIALAVEEKGTFVTMMEKAQADEAGQGDLFMDLGLRSGDGEAFFNTNMVLINYEVLTPMIKKLVDQVGEETFFEIIAPDLIINSKAQVDSDGKSRTYRQLEGAMGTVYLNLDRYWRERFGEALVHFINVDRNNRTKFFSPIKTAFDFYMQFHSDRFQFDSESYRLINNVPGQLPLVTLHDSSYKEVQMVLECFNSCQIKDLKQLTVLGKVNFSNCQLSGKVEVVNSCEERLEMGREHRLLENVKVVADSKGELTITPLD